jgi:hypothetical protein
MRASAPQTRVKTRDVFAVITWRPENWAGIRPSVISAFSAAAIAVAAATA